MDDLAQAAQTIGKILQVFTANSGMRLKYRVKARGGNVAGENRRGLQVEFSGPDTGLLIARNGEVLNALEHIATKILRLEPEEHDLVSFDADHFKEQRDRDLRASALEAIDRVQATGRSYAFAAMSSRERRMLHILLQNSGLPTASSGEGPTRFVVLYPRGTDPSSLPRESGASVRMDRRILRGR